MEKRKKLVKSIGYTLILITCIVIVISFVYEIKTTHVSFYKNPTMEAAVDYFFFVFPIIPEELSLFRSVYRLICFSPKTLAKICYIISAVIAFAALVFQLLVFTGVITPNILPEGPGDDGSRLMTLLLLLTEWPVVFLSFILGSVKSGKIQSE